MRKTNCQHSPNFEPDAEANTQTHSTHGLHGTYPDAICWALKTNHFMNINELL